MDPQPQLKAIGEKPGSLLVANNLQGETNGLGKKYQIQLTVSQANAIMKIISPCYSLQLEKEIKIKRSSNKKKNTYKKDSQNLNQAFDQISEIDRKNSNLAKINEEPPLIPTYNSQVFNEESGDALQPCLKILNLLKNHKSSWPFQYPVDPVTQGVPNYFQIIKEPMDLATIQNNLQRNFYVSQTQFHADINKIISNSYSFNQSNADFLKLTEEFENYYKRISRDVNTHRAPISRFSTKAIFNPKNKKQKSKQKNEHKYREPNQSLPVTIAEKRNLAMDLKKLPKEYMLGVANIVYEGQPPKSEELNIENLQASKIRQLQRYVQQKSILIQEKNQAVKRTHQDQNEDHSEQSSFASDSDS